MTVVQFADGNSFTYCHLRGIITVEFQVSYQGFAVEEKGKDFLYMDLSWVLPPPCFPQ